MTRSLRISVVIANHNYDRYVGAAIESALALDWSDVEVVVVDDGSTDRSRDVIQGYGNRVSAWFLERNGQVAATNHGLEKVSGDVVVFLDSDDVLPANLGTALAERWTERTSKAQFRMQRIGPDDAPIGDPFPPWRPEPSSGEIRRWFVRTSAYPTAPGSGNAYAMWFLQRIFPLSGEFGDVPDSACLAAAPLHGDVITLPDVVVGYRRHGANQSHLLLNDDRLPRQVRRARARWLFALRTADRPADERPLRRSRELLQFRLASWRIAPSDAGLPGESAGRLLVDLLRSPFHPGPETLAQRLMIVAWGLGVLTAPTSVVRRLLRARYGR